MKTNFFIFLFLVCCFGYSQKRLSEIDTLNYSTMIERSSARAFKGNMDINVYIAKDGSTLKLGDTLVLGQPSGINVERAYGKTEILYEYFFYGKPSGVFFKGIRYVPSKYRDYKVILRKMQFYAGSIENYVYCYVTPLPNADFRMIDDYITLTMVDTALERGEVYLLHPNKPLTREEAIEILKKKKEELDLEIITQAEYDKLKEELMPIIKS